MPSPWHLHALLFHSLVRVLVLIACLRAQYWVHIHFSSSPLNTIRGANQHSASQPVFGSFSFNHLTFHVQRAKRAQEDQSELMKMGENNFITKVNMEIFHFKPQFGWMKYSRSGLHAVYWNTLWFGFLLGDLENMRNSRMYQVCNQWCR